MSSPPSVSNATRAVASGLIPHVMLGLTPETRNVVFSPFSILYALGMLYAGASDDSSSQRELASFLFGASSKTASSAKEFLQLSLDEFQKTTNELLITGSSTEELDSGSGSSLLSANSIWGSNNVLENYKSQMKQVFAALIEESRDKAIINKWVEEKTKGYIRNLLSRDVTGAALINALYFRGSWENPFDSLDSPQPFHGASGTNDVPMMRLNMKRVPYYEDEDVEVVQLDYTSGSDGVPQGPEYAAVVALPKSGKTLNDFLRALKGDFINDWLEKSAASFGNIQMPKFKLSSSFLLKEVLSRAGCQEAMSPGASYTKISDPTMIVDEVIHQALVEVDEKGTVAAAATAVMMKRSLPRPEFEFFVDKPFLFFVINKSSGAVLFVARVDDLS